MIHTSTCPDENDLAAFADGRLSREARDRVTIHVSECSHCLDQVAFLKSTTDLEARVPDRLLEDARKLAEKTRRGSWRWAVAAAAVLLTGVLVSWPARRGEDVEPGRDVRGQTETTSIEVAAPRDGQVLSPGDELRWLAVGDALAYTVTVLTDEGDGVFEQRTERTELALPETLRWKPEASYYLWIRAHLRDGRTVRSRAVEFFVATARP